MTNIPSVDTLSSGLNEITGLPGLYEKCEYDFTGKRGYGEVASFRVSVTDSTGKEVGYRESILKRNIHEIHVGEILPEYTVMGYLENSNKDPNLKTSGLGTFLFKRSIEIASLLKQKCIDLGLIPSESLVVLVVSDLNPERGWTKRRCEQFGLPKLRGERWGKLI